MGVDKSIIVFQTIPEYSIKGNMSKHDDGDQLPRLTSTAECINSNSRGNKTMVKKIINQCASFRVVDITNHAYVGAE